jgi:hypothetical protein
MRAGRYSTSRRKACFNCSTSKTKCDGKAGFCTRCGIRGLSCHYPHTRTSDDSTPATHSTSASKVGAGTYVIDESAQSIDASLNSPSNSSSTAFTTSSFHRPSELSKGFESLDFSDLELCCPINADDIRNRWLNAFVPVAGQKLKEYPASITAFIYRILKSYAAITVNGRGIPPFVHPSQITAASISPPLATCLTSVRMCEKPLPGSENTAAQVLQREMNLLYEQSDSYDHMSLLAAFQAYLVYSMVLYFRLSQGSSPFLRQAMMNLQHLASSSSRQGLLCVAEQQRARPTWEAWIVAEAKRRTLLTMYLFDSVLSTQDNASTYLGTELRGLPASASHLLWRADRQQDWEIAYNVHLSEWLEGVLRIDELWPIPAHWDELSILERRNRVDRWLESVDAFGTMLYAVTSCTHGG